MRSDGQTSKPATPAKGILAMIGALLVATLLGGAAGALMAWIAPSDKFSWAGLVVAPLWLLLEVFLEGMTGNVFVPSKATRVISIVAVLGGFYVAWFYFQGT